MEKKYYTILHIIHFLTYLLKKVTSSNRQSEFYIESAIFRYWLLLHLTSVSLFNLPRNAVILCKRWLALKGLDFLYIFELIWRLFSATDLLIFEPPEVNHCIFMRRLCKMHFFTTDYILAIVQIFSQFKCEKNAFWDIKEHHNWLLEHTSYLRETSSVFWPLENNEGKCFKMSKRPGYIRCPLSSSWWGDKKPV